MQAATSPALAFLSRARPSSFTSSSLIAACRVRRRPCTPHATSSGIPGHLPGLLPGVNPDRSPAVSPDHPPVFFPDSTLTHDLGHSGMLVVSFFPPSLMVNVTAPLLQELKRKIPRCSDWELQGNR